MLVPERGQTTASGPRGRPVSEVRRRLAELTCGFRPGVARARGIAELDRMFRRGAPPEPPPDGFVRGRLLTLSTWGPFDRAVSRLGDLWMPWRGKAFDAPEATGVNLMDRRARPFMRMMWPGYEIEGRRGDDVAVFPFRTRVGPGAIDPAVTVLKIDYDFEANPRWIIRRILDEVVEVDDGLLLGKVLFRTGRRFHRIGFFSLDSEPV